MFCFSVIALKTFYAFLPLNMLITHGVRSAFLMYSFLRKSEGDLFGSCIIWFLCSSDLPGSSQSRYLPFHLRLHRWNKYGERNKRQRKGGE